MPIMDLGETLSHSGKFTTLQKAIGIRCCVVGAGKVISLGINLMK